MKDKQKAVFVTGASGGIGRVICETFSKEGYFVIATDKTQPDCKYNHFLKLDLLEFVNDSVIRKKFIKEIHNLLSKIELMGIVNNAALQINDSIENIKPEDFQDTFDVNVKAPLYFAQNLIMYLKESNGSILNIGSIHSQLSKSKFLSYAVSKSALKGLTKSMSIELGAYGISANLLLPAAIDTKMLHEGFNNDKDALSELESFHPIGRIGLPKEIAKVALFLIDNNEISINGASIEIDGGISNVLNDPSSSFKKIT